MPASLAATNILPTNPSFAGHGTFAVRSGWLKKGLDAIQSDRLDGSIFNRPDALATLGVGKNMVGAIRYWLLTTRMAREESRGRELQPTPLGELLFADDGWDPFLEDEATLWLLHWQLAGPNTASFSWAYAFNCFRDWEFGRDQLTQTVLDATHSLAKSPSRETIDRDVGCLLQTYVPSAKSVMSEDNLDCPLRVLGLIKSVERGHFRFRIEAKPSLPPQIFGYALAKFWQWKHGGAQTLPVWEICYAQGSPGLVFKLDENSVLNYLDGLAGTTQGRLRFEDTAQNRQVVLEESVRDFRPLSFLENYYAPAATLA